MSLVGSNGVKVTVTANNTANIPTAEFTNNKTEVGSLKIKKNVTVNGAATTGDSADGTYTFTVTGPDDYSSTQEITITNGASNTIQIDDLVPGEYTITETVPDGMSLVGSNGVKVTVTANNTSEIPTAEFTNNYSLSPCEGEIMVRKVLKGRSWTNNDSFTFTLKALEGAPMPIQSRISITKRDSDQIISFGEITFTEPGSYSYIVREVKGDLADIRYDTKEHSVIIEVVDDGHGNLVAKGGTQLIQTVTITNTYTDTPQTGDSSHVSLYMGLLISSMTGLLLLFLPSRRKKRWQ